jgi:hypothetical protein
MLLELTAKAARTRRTAALALALAGCATNPLHPDPNQTLAGSGKALAPLHDFLVNLNITDAIAAHAVRPPPQKELVDAQIDAMTAYVRSRPHQGAIELRASVPDFHGERHRLAEAALGLLPYLDVDRGEVELGRVAARALVTKLGEDAEYVSEMPGTDSALDFAAELRDGVGVLRLRDLSEHMADRVLLALNQWSAQPEPPRAFVLDFSECESADPKNTLTLVNAFTPGQTAFQIEYRDEDKGSVEHGVWRANSDWGVPASSRVPLYVWVSHRTSELVAAAVLVLREHGGAVVLGEKTAGTGRIKHWFHLPEDRWFGFTVAYVLDANGAPLAGRPLYPDVCVQRGQLASLREGSPAVYEADCDKPAPTLELAGVLRYVATAP